MKDLLTREGRKIFDNAVYSMPFSKGEVIFKQQTPVHQIKLIYTGLVKVSHNQSSSRPLILNLAGPGDLLELSSVFNGRIHKVTATALEATIIHHIDVQTFFTLYHNNPAFSEEVTRKIAQTQQHTLNQLIARNIKRLPGRVADTILYLYELNNKSHSFELPLSRIEMAQLAGTTKESLIRTLTEFRHDKIIKLDDRLLTINSLEILQTLSKFG